jgi:hypothetical protein
MATEAESIVEVQCTCGHGHDAHEHYRRGSDCSLCPAGVCATFTAALPPVAVPVTPVPPASQIPLP